MAELEKLGQKYRVALRYDFMLLSFAIDIFLPAIFCIKGLGCWIVYGSGSNLLVNFVT